MPHSPAPLLPRAPALALTLQRQCHQLAFLFFSGSCGLFSLTHSQRWPVGWMLETISLCDLDRG